MIGIYKITNIINNLCYVGQSVEIEKRWRAHTCLKKNSCRRLVNAIKKYGLENFKFEVIEEILEENLNEREKFWIKELNTLSPGGYNLTEGGDGGGRPSLETRERLRQANLGKKYSQETKDKQSKQRKGKKRSEETRKKMSESQRGRTLTEEQKKKISERNKGSKRSQETKDKMSKNRKGKTLRSVTCVTTGETWDGVKEASDKYKISLPHISSCCTGDRPFAGTHPTTGEKMFWVYPENLEEFMNTKFGVPLIRKIPVFTQERREAIVIFNKTTKSKPIFCLTTKEEFSSIGEAGTKYGFSKLHISECCSGRRKSEGVDPMSSRRMKWCFIEDKEERLSDPFLESDISKGCREIYCITTQENFSSIREAERKYKVHGQNIGNCCKQKTKSAGRHPLTNEPLKWCYSKDLDNILATNKNT